MRFADPAKFLEFYDKQLASRVVGLRHAEAVPEGAEVHLALVPPGGAAPLQLVGHAAKVMPRPDGSVRLRVIVDLEPGMASWLEAFAAGLRLGLEHGAIEAMEVGGESLIAESIVSDPLPTLMEDDLRGRVLRMESQTYYQVMGVSPEIDAPQLRQAYHALTRRYHPDLYFTQTDPAASRDAGRLYRRINEAYAVLKDPRRRRLYDRGLAGPPHTWTLRLTEESEQQAQRQRRVRRGDTPVGQTYWKLAREVLERARENEATIRPALRESARLLRTALAFEPENDHFRHALDHVKYRLSVAEDA